MSHDYIENYSNSESKNGLTKGEVISVLNGLIQTCKDGQEGFAQAVEGVIASQLKSTFCAFGEQRAQFAGELKNLVRNLGGDPENLETTLGSINRGWFDIKSIFTGNDEVAILNEAERVEDLTKSNYQEALKKGLPAHIYSVIQRQYFKIEDAHDTIKIMRDAVNKAVRTFKTID